MLVPHSISRRQDNACRGFAFAVLVLVLISVGPTVTRAKDKHPSAVEQPGFPYTLFPDVRKTAKELADLREDIDTLGPFTLSEDNIRRGYQSRFLETENEPVVIDIHLAEPSQVDTICLVPAVQVLSGTIVPGYGFPVRYRVEVDDPTSDTGWRTVIDQTGSDQPNPGVAPIDFELDTPQRCQTIRLTSTKHYKRADDLWVVALSEFFAFAGEFNVAAYAEVECSTSVESRPTWCRAHLTDFATPLGLPITNDPSPTLGFHSDFSNDVLDTKWVQLDLGQPTAINEVRMYPATPDNVRKTTYGFPREFRVELSNDPTFPPEATVTAAENSTRSVYNLEANIFCVPTHTWTKQPHRYVRLTTERLAYDNPDPTSKQHAFLALSEIEVYSQDGEQVPSDQITVTASDVLPSSRSGQEQWLLKGVTDGFTSHGKIVSYTDWLSRQSLRVEFSMFYTVIADSLSRRIAEIDRLRNILLLSLTTLAGVAGLLFAWLTRRRVSMRISQLRRQIARDLHDEIGSALGSIRLRSELAVDDERLSPDTRAELQLIRETAVETNNSMRDIVWLVDTEKASSDELLQHLRPLVHAMLAGIDVSLEESVHWRTDEVPLETRRHIVLAFKETLHNVRKHAQATHVDIQLVVRPQEFSFRVTDNGVGPDVDDDDPDTRRVPAGDPSLWVGGLGHKNLSARARDLGGFCTIGRSETGGTEVFWTAKLR